MFKNGKLFFMLRIRSIKSIQGDIMKYFFYKDCDGFVYYEKDSNNTMGLCYNTKREQETNLIIQRRLTQMIDENISDQKYIITDLRLLDLKPIGYLELSSPKYLPNIIRSLEYK